MPKKTSGLNWTALEKELTPLLGHKCTRRYINTLKHWYDHKGPEWVATRLKVLWNMALLVRSGDLEGSRLLGLDNSIKNINGIPKGIEGMLVRRYVCAKRPSVQRKYAAALRTYTGIYLPRMSSRQLNKCRESINTPGYQPRVKAMPCGTQAQNLLISLPFKKVNGSKRHDRIRSLVKLPPLQRLSGTSSYPHLLKIPSRDKNQPYLSMMSSIMTKGIVPEVLVETLGDFECRKSAVQNQLKAGDLTFGKINIIQEAGGKGRVICSPNAWVQYYCYPYHKILFNYVVSLEKLTPERSPKSMFGVSCVTDQVRGVYTAIKQLESGKPGFCVDLSSATDRFPLSVQVGVTEILGIPEFGQALKELKGPYIGLDGKPWYYNQGQPMGLYGSFPLFHLTHYGLLNGLSESLGLEGHENFCVLGDDVIIFDERLLKAYTNTLTQWGVPVSSHKCFQGDVLEFAGFIITETRDGSYTAYRPYKHGRDFDFSSVLQVLHAFGSSTKEWSDGWNKRFEAYSLTQGLRSLDLSPLIPEEENCIDDSRSLPGSRWLGSMMNLASYMPARDEFDYSSFIENWNQERDYLLHQKEQFEGQFQREANHDYSWFSPETYVAQEKERKNLFKGFWLDPTIRTYGTSQEDGNIS